MTCRQEADAKAPTSQTYDTLCKHYQDQLKCYRSCQCNDAVQVVQYNDAKKQFEEGLKMYDTSGSKTCNFQCGTGASAAAMLQAGTVVSAILAFAVALASA